MLQVGLEEPAGKGNAADPSVCRELENKFSTWGKRGITGDAGSVQAHDRHRDPAESGSVPHPDQPCNEQVHVSRHCLHRSSAVGKWFTWAPPVSFSPMISVRELSWGRRGFDIKSSLQIMVFFLARVAGEGFCLLLITLLRLLH